MKKYLLVVLVCLTASNLLGQEKNQIKSFQELMDALKTGANVNAVLHYEKCDLIVDGEKQERKIDAIGGMPVDVYEYFSKNLFGNPNAFLSTSQTKLIQNPQGKGYVYNYVKLKVYDNDKVEIIARYLHPRNYKEKMAEKFIGEINDGENNEGVFLFKN